MNDFEAIKSQFNIGQFIKQVAGGTHKKVGSVTGVDPCPFCGHKGCFRIWDKPPVYKCFSCGESGNIFSFSEKFFGISNKFENLKKVAEITGYELTDSRDIEKKAPELEIRQKIFNRASEIYHDILLNDAAALKILSHTRNYTIKTVKEFKIGYTGKSGDKLLALLKKEFTQDDLLKSGMVKMREGKARDFFIPKLFIFPHYFGSNVNDFTIKDSQKHIKKDQKKVINYRLPEEFRLSDTKMYNADALYYDEIVLCEGEHDAIQVMRNTGKHNALAVCGKPSPADLQRLERYAKNKVIYLSFDQDKAGDKLTQDIFLHLWGIADSIYKITWDEGKDIDEYLRGLKKSGTNSQKILQKIMDKAPDAMAWLLTAIDEDDDINKMMRIMEPFKDAALKLNDVLQFDIFLENLKDNFKKGKLIAKHLRKQYDQGRLEQLNNSGYLSNLPFYEKDGVYFHRQSKSDINLSNFRMVIDDLILYDDELYYRCTLKSVSGEIAEKVEFAPAERVDSRKFRTKLVSQGAFHFTGRDNQLSGIWQFEESKSEARYIHYIKQYGWVDAEKLWLFENCAIANGKMYERDPDTDYIPIGKKHYMPHDVIVYSGSTPKLDITSEYTAEFANEVAMAFHKMLDSKASGKLDTYAGYLFLGFVPATIYSLEIFEKYSFFPILFSYGPPRMGKTAATKLLLSFFGFIASPESWDDASIPGTMMFIKQLSSMPCWYDEFLNNHKFQQMLGTIKNIYNRAGSGKGGLGEKRIKREINGTLWLSGEDNPANEAVLSRCILFRFGALNPHKNKSYNFLVDNQTRLSAITRNLLLEKSEDKARELIRGIETYKDFIMSKSERVDARMAANHAIARAGLMMMDIDVPEELDHYLIQHAEKTAFYSEEENPRNHFFAEVNYLFAKKLLFEYVRVDLTENELYICFEATIRIIQQDIRKRGEALKIKAGSVKDYLSDMPGFTGHARKYFRAGEKNIQRNCMVFNLDNLPQNIHSSLDDVLTYFKKDDIF